MLMLTSWVSTLLALGFHVAGFWTAFWGALVVSLVSLLLSMFVSLGLTAFLAWLFVVSTKLTGFSDDATFLLVGLAEGLDVRGIVLAGVVIGSLGVLDDVVVTQVSSVWELKRADPTLGTMELFTPAMRIVTA